MNNKTDGQSPELTFTQPSCPEQTALTTKGASPSNASFLLHTSGSATRSINLLASGGSTNPLGEGTTHHHISHNDQVEAMDTSDPLDCGTYHDWEDSFVLALLGLPVTPLEDLEPSFPDLLGANIRP